MHGSVTKSVSAPGSVYGILMAHTEMSALWLKVFTQYLFHSSPRSSASREDLKICTSNG